MHARKTKSGLSAKKIKPWRLEAQMEFVKPYLFTENDNKVSNIPSLPAAPILVSSLINDSSFVLEDLSEINVEKDEPKIQQIETSAKKNLATKKSTSTAADMLSQYNVHRYEEVG